jgi:hypothetical protein
VFREFDGFNGDDFDDSTLISVWPIRKIIDLGLDSSRLPYLNFADEGLEAIIFSVCLSDETQPIYMGNEQAYESYSHFWESLLASRRKPLDRLPVPKHDIDRG